MITNVNSLYSNDQINEWINEINRRDQFLVETKKLNELEKWTFNKDSGDLEHESGGFFSIKGLDVKTNVGTVKHWTQPIIDQREIGLLGIIAKKMGIEEKFTEGKSQEDWQEWIYKQTFDKAVAANIEIPKYEKLFGKHSGNVLMPFSSTIDTLKNKLKKTILISSSNFSQTIQTPVSLSLKETSDKLNPNLFDQKPQPLGLLLEGKFSSVFDNRIPPVELKEKKITGESQMIIFSSGSVAENQLDKGNPLELGYDKWTNNFYSNKVFLQKTIHHLMGNQKLLHLQNKTVYLPQLDFQKVKQISGLLKTSLLIIPFLILLALGVWVYSWRTRKFGR